MVQSYTNQPMHMLGLNWVSYPHWTPVYFFFPLIFWNLFPYVTKQGVPVLSFPDFTESYL
jgi:hypothetical protein